MMAGETPSSPDLPDHPVWQALCAYQIGPQHARLGFTRRLARDNGWTPDNAERVVEEYLRFCFLAVTADHAVTPSDAVDQAWHLHLTYSRDYWERFCPHVLGKALHHSPTIGGRAEQTRFFAQYAATLRSYEAVFGQPPADLWPDAQSRLKEDPKARRVHPRDGLVLSRRGLGLALLLCAMLGALAGWMLARIG